MLRRPGPGVARLLEQVELNLVTLRGIASFAAFTQAEGSYALQQHLDAIKGTSLKGRFHCCPEPIGSWLGCCQR